MESCWLHHNQANRCLLFLAGWGMDPGPFQGIPAKECDVLLVYDYNQLTGLDLEAIAAYQEIHLLAWSMGVWVAAHLFQPPELQGRFTSSTAIGGTLEPIHPSLGIPPASYQQILDSFSASTLAAFQDSMFTQEAERQRFLAHPPKRSLDNVQAELAAFQAHYQRFGAAADIFSHKLVTSRDRVFPLKNQLRAWSKQASTILKLPHFPFYALQGWQELIPTPVENETTL
ncbi:pimeloyl-ACP methyl esterase BioG family protein [Desulfogranum mediterraneum]|uniref:pimeloyl-ACP methyl esterase BioG family protein n=1 Tax=Desulfogranum mediterraneum TaxID=160661 RepID=UPI000415BFC5|nr:pimeloyl-ACP methyl esterase BioG family protein [Desulfogranum mediterraneum]